MKLEGELASLKKNFYRVCVSLYNIFAKEMEIIIRRKKVHLQDLFDMEKESGLEIDKIFRSKNISQTKKDNLSGFVDLLYKQIKTQKSIRDNEKVVDGELMIQMSGIQTELDEKKMLVTNLKEERIVLMESEENLVRRVEDANNARQQGIKSTVYSFFPEYDEAKVILGGGVVNKIVKLSLDLVGEVDTENEMILQATDKLTYILDQVSFLNIGLEQFLSRTGPFMTNYFQNKS